MIEHYSLYLNKISQFEIFVARCINGTYHDAYRESVYWRVRMTIKDVALEANVSLATVSRVLNNNATVNPEYRIRAEKAIKKLGYTPNNAARSLASSKTNTIGVIVNNLHDTFFCDLIKGFETGAQNTGFNVVFASILGSSVEKKQQYMDYFSKGTVDGVVLYGSRMSDDVVVNHIRKSNISYVIIENDVDYDNCFKLLVDNADGTKEGVSYLVSNGFKRIGFISGNPMRKVMVDRLNGFFNGLRENGLDINQCPVEYITDDTSEAYDLVRRMIAKGSVPEALFCADDAIASYAISAFLDAGLDVPSDVSVLGFDNRSILPGHYHGPEITTIMQPLFTIGKESIELLSGYLRGKIEAYSTKIFKTTLIDKASVRRKKDK